MMDDPTRHTKHTIFACSREKIRGLTVAILNFYEGKFIDTIYNVIVPKDHSITLSVNS
jgi:hypothetical protein